jgi:hypothetical protein
MRKTESVSADNPFTGESEHRRSSDISDWSTAAPFIVVLSSRLAEVLSVRGRRIVLLERFILGRKLPHSAIISSL